MATSQIALVVELIKQQAQMIERVERGTEEANRKLDIHGEDIQCLKLKVGNIRDRVEIVEKKPREQRQSIYVWIAIIGGALGILGLIYPALVRLLGDG
jgi:ABC-type phosphate transport system ATPase subunit